LSEHCTWRQTQYHLVCVFEDPQSIHKRERYMQAERNNRLHLQMDPQLHIKNLKKIMLDKDSASFRTGKPGHAAMPLRRSVHGFSPRPRRGTCLRRPRAQLLLPQLASSSPTAGQQLPCLSCEPATNADLDVLWQTHSRRQRRRARGDDDDGLAAATTGYLV
jgi:hypothetical protein